MRTIFASGIWPTLRFESSKMYSNLFLNQKRPMVSAPPANSNSRSKEQVRKTGMIFICKRRLNLCLTDASLIWPAEETCTINTSSIALAVLQDMMTSLAIAHYHAILCRHVRYLSNAFGSVDFYTQCFLGSVKGYCIGICTHIYCCFS
jgi:hypothetical protein